jgi:hypothetical protein
MKINKQFLSVLISVLICVFVFGIIVYATTTVGEDIAVGEDLTVSGLFTGVHASISDDLTIGSNIIFSDSVASISGDFNVDGNTYLGRLGGGRTFIQYNSSDTTLVGVANTPTLIVKNLDTTDNNYAAIGFGTLVNRTGVFSSSGFSSAGIGAQFLDHESNSTFDFPADLYFWTGYSPSGEIFGTPASEKMRITAAGNVGIGDTFPAYKLSVDGTASVSGDAYFSGVVSASDANGLLVGEGEKITAGTASPSDDCIAGSLYLRTGTLDEDSSIYLCNPANTWNALNMTSL